MKFGAKVDLRPKHLQIVGQVIHLFDFIEVYFTPNAVVDHNDALATHDKWVVHAPHQGHGVNLAANPKENKLVEKAIIFAGKLGADYVIVHPGFVPDSESSKREDYVKMLLFNLKKLKSLCKRCNVELLLENVTPRGVENSLEIGFAPEEMNFLLNKGDCGFVLDFSHAYHASVFNKVHYKNFVLSFMKLDPQMFHLYDSRANQIIDLHMIPTQGDLDIPFFVSLVGNKRVTLELHPPSVENYVNAMKYLKQIESTLQSK
jgi:sugar phosphate isomerase/epimerase